MSVDPLASNYPSWSPYNYSLNDPIGKKDPNGEWVWGAVIGAAADYAMQSIGSGNWGLEGKDWGSIAISAGAGLASGGLSVLTKGYKVTKTVMAVKTLGNAAINVAEGYAKSDGNYSVSEGLVDAAVGMGSSVVGDAVDNSISKGMKNVSAAGKAADKAKFKAEGVNKNPKASSARKARYNNAAKKAEEEFESSVDEFWNSSALENAGTSNAASAGTGAALNATTDEEK